MMKKSHLVIGILGTLALQPGANLTNMLILTAGAAVGSTVPDWDLILHIPHRGITHWLIWPAVVLLAGHAYPFLIGLALGWILHIAADALTVEGLRPFWPLTWRVRGFLTTGGLMEYFFVIGAMGSLIYYFMKP